MAEFLQTINVDNECFYSDHLIKSDGRLASTRTIIENDPFFLEKKRQRVQSFDLANFMRKDDYMLSLLEDEENQGPLKIINLPTPTDVIALSEATPRSLVGLDLFYQTGFKRDEEMKGPEFVFYDANDQYEE